MANVYYYDTPTEHARALCPTCHEACQREGWEGYRLLDTATLEGTDATHCDGCGAAV